MRRITSTSLGPRRLTACSILSLVFLVALATPGIPVVIADAPGYSLSAYALSAPQIDGNLGDGWASAARINFNDTFYACASGYCTPGSLNGTILEMNDANNLYLGVDFAWPSPSLNLSNLYLVFSLDGRDTGAYYNGMKQIGYCGPDSCWNSTGNAVDMTLVGGANDCCWARPASFFMGGTNHVTAAASLKGSYAYVEVQYPLCSGESYEMCFEGGSEIGFQMTVQVAVAAGPFFHGQVPSGSFPTNDWGDIKIAGDVPFRQPPTPLPLLLPSKTLLDCSPRYVTVEGWVICNVSVTGLSPTGLVYVNLRAQPVGKFYALCALVSGRCTVKFRYAEPPGGSIISATYQGDSVNLQSGADFHLSVYSIVPTCTPLKIDVGTYSACSVKVAGETLRGVITWSSSEPGRFSRPRCTLVKGQCKVFFRPDSSPLSSDVSVNASYVPPGGQAVSNVFDLSVGRRQSSVSVTCRPDALSVNAASTCRARVVGYNPTGEVSWNLLNGPGSVRLSQTKCQLSRGVCSVILTGVAPGIITLYAVYNGDGANYFSAVYFAINVK